MKKLLLLASVAFFTAFGASAQCAPDNQYTEPGIYPDSATNFGPACTGQPYTQLITNVVPEDTVITVGGFPLPPIPIDSIVLDNVTGLPSGMSIACNPMGCAFEGGTTGCAIITGTCNTPGTYTPIFNLSAYVGGSPTPQTFTIDYYKIVVSSCNVGIEENSAASFRMYPNPASNKVTIEGGENEIQSISLTNAEGKTVRTYQVTGAASLEINMEGLNNGLYFVNIDYSKGTEVLKLIKK